MSSYGVGQSFNTQYSPDFMDLNNPDVANESAKTSPKQGTSMNIVLTSDSLEVPFNVAAGHIGFYQAAPDRPNIEFALFKLPTAPLPHTPDETAFQNNYEKILKKLSGRLREKMKNNRKLPREERDVELFAFELALLFMTNIVTVFEEMSQEHTLGDAQIQANYSALPGYSFAALMNFSSEVMNDIQKDLASSGPNSLNYDLYVNVINRIREAVIEIQAIQEKKGEQETNDSTKKTRLIDRLTELEGIVNNHVAFSTKYSVLMPILALLKIFIPVRQDHEIACFMLSWNMSNIANLSSSSSSGAIGPQIQELINSLIGVLGIKAKLSPIDVKVITLTFESSAYIMTWIANECLGHWEEVFDGFDSDDQIRGGIFLRELGLLFIESANLTFEGFRSIGEILGLRDEDNDFLGKLGRLFNALLLIGMAKKDQREFSSLIDVYAPFIPIALQSIEASLQESVNKGEANPRTTAAWLSRSQLIKISLEKRNLDSLRTALDDMLAAWKVSKGTLQQELIHLADIAKQTHNEINNALAVLRTPATTVIQSA